MSEIEIKSQSLVRVEEAKAMLASCVRLDEAKDIRDQAEAVKHYLARRGASREAQNDAAEIKLRAERRLGELLDPAREKRGRGPGPKLKVPSWDFNKNQSSRWQNLARLKPAVFESYIESRRRDPDGEITTAGALRLQASLERHPPTVEVPARLGDFSVIYTDLQSGIDYDDICAVPVKQLAARDCVMFAWATRGVEESVLALLSWGFAVVDTVSWNHPGASSVGWTIRHHDLMLIGTRGEPDKPSRPMPSVIVGGPPEVREWIDKEYGSTSKLDLFGNTTRTGWKSWSPNTKSAA